MGLLTRLFSSSGSRKAWVLPCPICNRQYVLGINAAVATEGELNEMRAVVGMPPSGEPDLVTPYIKTGPGDFKRGEYEAPPVELNEAQWFQHDLARDRAFRDIAQGRSRYWSCSICKNVEKPTEYPALP